MLLGYNTNGLAHHAPQQAVELLADIGYQSVAITLDHGTLNPSCSEWEKDCDQMQALLQQYGLRSVIETGAKFLLDPRVKHEPTLMSTDSSARDQRVQFLKRAVDIAERLGSDCVSLWSGIVRDDADDDELLTRLAGGLRQVIDYAIDRDVQIGFEPEPGMYVDNMSRYERLLQWVDAPNFLLTLDVGHLYCQGEVPIADYIARWASRIVNVHIEDMRGGSHEHLMFGEGEMNFAPIVEAFRDIGFQGGLHVELDRHSHDGSEAAQRAYDFLSPLITNS